MSRLLWPPISYLVRRLYGETDTKTEVFQGKDGKPVVKVTLGGTHSIYVTPEACEKISVVAINARRAWEKEYVANNKV